MTTNNEDMRVNRIKQIDNIYNLAVESKNAFMEYQRLNTLFKDLSSDKKKQCSVDMQTAQRTYKNKYLDFLMAYLEIDYEHINRPRITDKWPGDLPDELKEINERVKTVFSNDHSSEILKINELVDEAFLIYENFEELHPMGENASTAFKDMLSAKRFNENIYSQPPEMAELTAGSDEIQTEQPIVNTVVIPTLEEEEAREEQLITSATDTPPPISIEEEDAKPAKLSSEEEKTSQEIIQTTQKYIHILKWQAFFLSIYGLRDRDCATKATALRDFTQKLEKALYENPQDNIHPMPLQTDEAAPAKPVTSQKQGFSFSELFKSIIQKLSRRSPNPQAKESIKQTFKNWKNNALPKTKTTNLNLFHMRPSVDTTFPVHRMNWKEYHNIMSNGEKSKQYQNCFFLIKDLPISEDSKDKPISEDSKDKPISEDSKDKPISEDSKDKPTTKKAKKEQFNYQLIYRSEGKNYTLNNPRLALSKLSSEEFKQLKKIIQEKDTSASNSAQNLSVEEEIDRSINEATEANYQRLSFTIRETQYLIDNYPQIKDKLEQGRDSAKNLADYLDTKEHGKAEPIKLTYDEVKKHIEGPFRKYIQTAGSHSWPAKNAEKTLSDMEQELFEDKPSSPKLS